MNLIYEVYSTNTYPMLECPERQVIMPLPTQKNGSTSPLKSQDRKMGGTFESAYRTVNHLIKYYKDSFLAACETQQVPVIKSMTATEFQARGCTGEFSCAKAKTKVLVSRTQEKEKQKKRHEAQFVPPPKTAIMS